MDSIVLWASFLTLGCGVVRSLLLDGCESNIHRFVVRCKNNAFPSIDYHHSAP
jgi:hypothetical protein